MGLRQNQLAALLRKNITLIRRRYRDLLRELALPIVLLAVLIILKRIVPNLKYDATMSYPDHPLALNANAKISPAAFGKLIETRGTIGVAPCEDDGVRTIQEMLQVSPETSVFCGKSEYAPPGTCYNLTYQCFNTSEELIDKATNFQTLFAGITFTTPIVGPTAASVVSFNIHMNSSVVIYPSGGDYYGLAGPSNQSRDVFLETGFMAIQAATQNAILGLVQNSSAPPVTMSTRQFPNEPYYLNLGLLAMQYVLPIYMTMVFSVQIRTALTAVLEEKEGKLREGMLMMGLSSSTNTLGWFATFGIKSLLLVLVASFAGKFGGLFLASDLSVLLIYFALFSVSCISYTFFVATFFETAKLGSMAGYMIFIIAGLPAVVITGDGVPVAAQYALSLISPTGFGVGLTVLNNAEGVTAEGVTWSNLMVPPPGSKATIGGVMLVLLLDVVVYSLLAWYLDQVVSSSFGVKKRCCFCFEACFKGRRKVGNQEPLMVDPPADSMTDIEPVTGDAIPSVKVRGLKKGFISPTVGEVNAVDGLSLDMYEGEITALLGHNGAGKTTTINVLTGMLPPTGGDATIFGKSITDEMDDIRRMVGVCPQHNILWPLLTVQEHLELFAGLKGMTRDQATAEAKRALAEVGLADKADAMSETLSGGMKRKLSVAMALLGDPRIVFLDEPTAGMDPQARRTMWDLLARHKQKRVIVLTTHYMDEADLLGDRIAIMSKGKLRVMGSSLFLKSKFGIGYHLIVEMQPEAEAGTPKVIEEMVRHHVRGAEPEPSSSLHELNFVLPRASAPYFAALFEDFDTRTSQVKSYGLSQTTLEEVFVRLADDTVVANNTSPKPVEGEHTEATTERKSFEKAGPLAPPAVPSSGNIQKMSTKNAELHKARKIDSGERTFGGHLHALVKKRMLIAKRDKKSLWFQCGLPVMFLCLSAVFRSLQNLSTPTASQVVISSAILDSSGLSSRYPLSVPFGYEPGSTIPSWVDKFPLPFVGSSGQVVVSPLTRQAPSAYQAFSDNLLQPGVCDGHCESAIWLNNSYGVALFNSSVYVAPSLLLNWMGTAMLRDATNSPTAAFATSFIPFPKAPGQPVIDYGSVVYATTSALYGSFGFITIAAIVVIFLVKERTSGAKHQQLLAGVNIFAYWASNLVFDYIFYLIPVAGCLIMIQALSLTGLNSPAENYGTLILVYLLFGLAVLPLGYSVSFLFTSPSTAQTVTLVGQSLIMVAFTGTNIGLTLGFPDSPGIAQGVNYLGYLLPSFALNAGMSALAKAGALCKVMKQSGLACDNKSPLAWDIAGSCVTFLVIDAVLYSCLTLGIEFYLRRSPDAGAPESQRPENEDVDVTNERTRVTKETPDNVSMIELHKVWPAKGKQPAKVAVTDITLGIKTGTCFGLLGVNGAGKTTLLSMLTGVTKPTSGNATVAGFSIRTELEQVHKLLGFCPQFDALFDDLTGREHLELYAALKAIPVPQVSALVNSLLELVTLTEHAGKLVKEFSGGNKRKLSLAIALLGTPRVVMLDEPSAGMDPMARRAILEVINESLVDSETCVILTTHLMEECEALAHRIGIMVNGGLACLGSLQHLKSRFGAFWQMELQTSDEKSSDDAVALVKALSPEAELLEWYRGHFLFKLPSAQVPLAKVFKVVEAAKDRLSIVDYSVSQCTLEQIFLAFAKHQIETGE